ncbi:MAG: hydroxymethylpyrimidine/phosphomethylpyrimidine kinase [Candidatus Hydrogenedentota bacterium]
MSEALIPKALTIAGSDSGGGAGIQADLKTFAALGVYGMSAIAAVTSQNTYGVSGVVEMPPAFVAQQIDDVAADIGVDAAKTGMLSNAEIVEAVADAVTRNGITKLVVDPVMVAKSGDSLLRESAREAIVRVLLPRALVITPNLPEAAVLTGIELTGEDSYKEAARRLHGFGIRHVLIKGGHAAGPDAVDWLYDGENFVTFTAPRIETKNTHGTGCTYSAAIAANLAKGMDVVESVESAKIYLTEAIRRSLSIGHGHGPLNHMWQQETST